MILAIGHVLMKTISITQARSDIYNLVVSVAKSHEAIKITGKTANVVLVAESDWRAIQETLYLLSIPGMRESIVDGLKQPLDQCGDDLDW